MFRQPRPLARPMEPAAVAANAQSFQQKLSELEPSAPTPDNPSPSNAPVEVRFTEEEVQAALVEGNAPGGVPFVAGSTPGGDQIAIDSAVPTVVFDNDVVKGQFQAEVAGKKVYVTVAGHLGAKDGYATFEPTEFRIGNMTVPVSLVNSTLQKKMAEQRDRLKLPDFISDISVQNSQLVIKRK